MKIAVKPIAIRKLTPKAVDNIKTVKENKLFKNTTDAVNYILENFDIGMKKETLSEAEIRCNKLEIELLKLQQFIKRFNIDAERQMNNIVVFKNNKATG